jgi:hypothetical protein
MMQPDRELERELRELGSRIEYPPTPNLPRAVRSRLEEETERTPRRGRFWPALPGLRPAAAAAAVVVIIVALSPAVRTTVAGWFVSGPGAGSGGEAARAPSTEQAAPHAGSVKPSGGGSLMPSAGGPRPLGEELGFGNRISLREARRVAADELLLPQMPKLGKPDEVYASGPSRNGGIVLVYRARGGLPPLGDTGIGLVLTELPGEVEAAYLAGGADAGIEEVSVGGERGYWVPAGSRHSSPVKRTGDLPGSVLFWEQGGLALRLEADISKQEAIHIAESVR